MTAFEITLNLAGVRPAGIDDLIDLKDQAFFGELRRRDMANALRELRSQRQLSGRTRAAAASRPGRPLHRQARARRSASASLASRAQGDDGDPAGGTPAVTFTCPASEAEMTAVANGIIRWLIRTEP